MDRQQAAWYYRLGGQTLGPVPWTEIEQLTRDTVDAEDLLVARGGDEQWRAASDVIEEHPELVEEAPPAGAEQSEELESLVEEPGDEHALSAGPSAAASEVLEDATRHRDAGRPAPAANAVAPGAGAAFAPQHGLGEWLNQAWQMVIDEIWPWIGAQLLALAVSLVTLGIAAPPLLTGLHMMSLKRFRGERIGAGDVFQGFGRFLDSWGLSLIMAMPLLVVMAPFMILFAIPVAQAETGATPDDVAMAVGAGVLLLLPVLWLLMVGVQAMFFYSWVLVADGHGAWESVTRSWKKVAADFWSHLGMWLILGIISSLGGYVCAFGGLVTYPLLPCSQVAIYMWHFRRTR